MHDQRNFLKKRLQPLFILSDQQLTIQERRKADTLRLLSREIQSIRPQPVQNRKALIHLIRYADRNLPGIHLFGCVIMLLLLLYMGNRSVPAQDDTLLLPFLSMTLPCFLVFFTVVEIRQVCFVKTAELNATCFFQVGQLAALSLILSGLLNLLAVTAGILLVGLQWKIRLLQIGLYMLVPFIFMQCLCFGYMLTEMGRRHLWLNAVFLLPLCLFCLLFLQNRKLYTEPALFLWGAALLAGIAILAAELKLFFAKLQKGEILCID